MTSPPDRLRGVWIGSACPHFPSNANRARTLGQVEESGLSESLEVMG